MSIATDLILLLCFLAFLISLAWLFRWNRNVSVRKITRDLNIDRKNKIIVQYELTQNNPVLEQTFMSVNAEMYITENFVLLLPSSKSSILSFGKSYLPMIFTHDLQSVRLKTNHGNVVNPESMTIPYPNTIRIEYNRINKDWILNEVLLDLMDPSRAEEFHSIKTWQE